MNKGKKIFVILFFGIILLTSTVIPFAFGQTLSPEEEGCVVKQFKEKAYAPFRIVMTGDPAIRNSVEDQHSDQGSRWHMDRAEFEDENSPTTLNFFTESVDDWKWTVRTEYKTEALEPRPITVSYQADNVEFLSETFYRTGFDFCIIYYVAVREAPHIFTEDEILETADKIQEENFEVVGTQINALVKEVTATKNSNNVVNAIAVILVLVLILTNAMQSRGNKQLKRGMSQERQLLSSERARVSLQTKQNRIDNQEFRKEALGKIDNFIDQITMKYNSLHLDLTKEPQIEFDTKIKCPHCKTIHESLVDLEGHIKATHQDIVIQNKEAEESILGLGPEQHKGDFLHLEDAKKMPKSFNLLHKNIKERGTQLKDKIFSKEDEPTPGERTVNYYEEYYNEKLNGHSDLIKEYDLQCDAYKQTQSKDAHLRTLALSTLSTTKKFDPREELED